MKEYLKCFMPFPRVMDFVLVFVILSVYSSCSSAQNLETAFPNLSFSSPVFLTHCGDNSNRLFVVEQEGIIKTFDNNKLVGSAKDFLNIKDRVDAGGEKGLLGLAFSPDYKTSGYFYVNYTTSLSGNLQTRISRFSVKPGNPDEADSSSELILLAFNQPYPNHNAGMLLFGNDGYLYIGTGDGGSAGDPQNNSQNLQNILGKMLRIDVNHATGVLNYSIPPDNPFANNTSGYKKELYAYGFRNPYRFSLDDSTGNIWIADVGQNTWEEIDILQKGGNYGWNVMEGKHCYSPFQGCNEQGLINPVYEYNHSSGNCSITGGYVYGGSSLPELKGYYVYGDYCSGNIWRLKYQGDSVVENKLLFNTSFQISSFGEDRDKELYVVDYTGGKIYRISPSYVGLKENEIEKTSFSVFPNPFDEQLEFSFYLDRPEKITLDLVDTSGKSLMKEEKLFGKGEHVISWKPLGLADGVYYYNFKTTHWEKKGKVILKQKKY